MDQLPRLGKRQLICLLSFTCNCVVFVWRGFLFLWVLGMGYVILLWHSLSLPYNYFPRRPSYGVYISQLIRFASVCSHVDELHTRNKCFTAKLLKQGYRYHKLRKAFSKFYRRHYELISKFNVGLKSLLPQGLSEPEFYGDLVYKFKKIRGMTDFSDQFRIIIMCYTHIGYNRNVMRQSAC